MSDPKLSEEESRRIEEGPKEPLPSLEDEPLPEELMKHLAEKWRDPPGMDEEGNFYNTYVKRPDGHLVLTTTLAGAIRFRFDDAFETVIVADTRHLLSFAVPGYPEPCESDFTTHLRREAGVRMRKMPLEIAYEWVEECDAAAYAQAFASPRASRPPTIQPISERIRQRIGVKAAISATYPLRPEFAKQPKDAPNVNFEELWALATDKGLARLVVRSDNRALTAYDWAAVAGAILGSVHFAASEPELLARPIAALWPENQWLSPGTPPQLRREASARVRELGQHIRSLGETTYRPLIALAARVEAPHEPLLESDYAELAQLLKAIPKATWEDTVKGLHTWQDLRGFILATLAAV